MGHEAHFNSEGKLYLRKSMIEEYGFCPYRFWKTWFNNETRETNQAMLIGTRFHDFAYKFFDHCDAYPMERWDEMIPPEFIEVERDMATWFVNYERDRRQKLIQEGRSDEWRPMARELHMKSDVLLLEGTVDRVDWWDKSKDELSIVEYKTGKSFNLESIEKQLAFYSILWSATVGRGSIVKMIYINPRLQVVRIISLDKWHIDRIMVEVSKVRKAINEKNFPPKCSEVKYAMCQMCEPDECGLFKIEDRQPFKNFVITREKTERFIDIYDS